MTAALSAGASVALLSASLLRLRLSWPHAALGGTCSSTHTQAINTAKCADARRLSMLLKTGAGC